MQTLEWYKGEAPREEYYELFGVHYVSPEQVDNLVTVQLFYADQRPRADVTYKEYKELLENPSDIRFRLPALVTMKDGQQCVALTIDNKLKASTIDGLREAHLGILRDEMFKDLREEYSAGRSRLWCAGVESLAVAAIGLVRSDQVQQWHYEDYMKAYIEIASTLQFTALKED